MGQDLLDVLDLEGQAAAARGHRGECTTAPARRPGGDRSPCYDGGLAGCRREAQPPAGRAPGRAAAHRGRDQRGPRSRRSSCPRSRGSCGGSSTTGSSTSSCPSPTATLVPALRRGLRQPRSRRASASGPGEGIVGAAAAPREAVFVPDVTQGPALRLASSRGCVAELAIPLVHQDRLVGVLNIEGPDAEAFTAGRAHRAAGAGQPPRGGHRERDPLPRGALVRGPPGHPLRDRQGDRVDPRPRRAARSGWPRSCKRVIDYEMFGILLLDEERQELVLRKAVHFGTVKREARASSWARACAAPPRAARSRCSWATCAKDPRYVDLDPGDALGAGGAARPQGPRGRRLRPRVPGARPLHRRARQGADARWPARWRWPSRTRASTRSSRRKEERVWTRAARSPSGVQHGLFPEEPPSGRGLGGLRALPPRARAGGRPLRLLRHGRGRARAWPWATWRARACPPRSTAPSPRAAVRARAFERRAPADLMTRVNRTLRRRGVEGLFCTSPTRSSTSRQRTVRLANSGLPYPLALPRGRRARASRWSSPACPWGPSTARPTRSAWWPWPRETSSSSTPTA